MRPEKSFGFLETPRVRQNVKWVLFSVCGAQIPATAVAPGEGSCSTHDCPLRASVWVGPG